MPTAYVLINCDLDHKSEVMKELSQLPGILESVRLDAAYDILVKLNLRTIEELKETIKGHIKNIPDIKSTITLVAMMFTDLMERIKGSNKSMASKRYLETAGPDSYIQRLRESME